MTIEILPARLANQIAAGEVVERPASVIKELVENSLDAGATSINIAVDKGGIKRIRISDNGIGIVKDELTLALSRHATSKIKDLSDLEAINSLGFRGEALASISSVARLTLTSKPKEQETAWQAVAEGRDMAVAIKPAAHPNGTTIEVLDLFFNTPARRKFLRTEKTEFNHIDEVIRRIALARFDVAFTLTHNSKVVRQYRVANTAAQNAKRVAMVCGQKFVDSAIEVNCQHDDMTFSGWLAKPSFVRNQNDLCYSYVNGRMMRDKLINHAIRQAYAELLPADTYPAFVLFLSLNHREVDVNVHPAKHEVRFHQSRYVHDFIYSVCHQALMENHSANYGSVEQSEHATDIHQVMVNDRPVEYERADYIKPLQQVSDVSYSPQQSYTNYGASSQGSGQRVTAQAVDNYQQLMTAPISDGQIPQASIATNATDSIDATSFFICVEQEKYGVFKHQEKLKLLSLLSLAELVNKAVVKQHWQQGEVGLISQPLLLPLMLILTESQVATVEKQQTLLQRAGIFCQLHGKQRVQVRQYPALLRHNDVQSSLIIIIEELSKLHPKNDELLTDDLIISAIAKGMNEEAYSELQAHALWEKAQNILSTEIIQTLLLNSAVIDLTSSIKQLETLTLN